MNYLLGEREAGESRREADAATTLDRSVFIFYIRMKNVLSNTNYVTLKKKKPVLFPL